MRKELERGRQEGSGGWGGAGVWGACLHVGSYNGGHNERPLWSNIVIGQPEGLLCYLHTAASMLKDPSGTITRISFGVSDSKS